MSDYCVRKRNKLVRRKKKYFVRILYEETRFYVFIVILSFSTMAIVNFVKAVFS
ncbi:MAG: hypothetical protein ACUZ8N_11955 [Candidatus Scalindua sp.]